MIRTAHDLIPFLGGAGIIVLAFLVACCFAVRNPDHRVGTRFVRLELTPELEADLHSAFQRINEMLHAKAIEDGDHHCTVTCPLWGDR